MRISDWSSDVCSSDLTLSDDSGRLSSEMESSRRLSDGRPQLCRTTAQSGKKNWSGHQAPSPRKIAERIANRIMTGAGRFKLPRSEEHTSELQSLMRISYAVFCLKKKKENEKKDKKLTK